MSYQRRPGFLPASLARVPAPVRNVRMRFAMLACSCLAFSMLFGQTPANPRAMGLATSSPQTRKIAASFARSIHARPLARYQEPITYLDASGTSWVICPMPSDGKIRIRWHAGPVQTIPPPAGTTPFGTCYGQGALWCTAGDDAHRRIELFRLDPDIPSDGWLKVGYFDGVGGAPLLVTPLQGKDEYLGISTTGFCEPDGKHASFVGIFKRDAGRIYLKSCKDMPFEGHANVVEPQWIDFSQSGQGQGEPPQTAPKKDGYWFAKADPSILTPSLVLPSISDDYIVIGAASAGVLWVFGLRHGQLRRTINLTGLDEQHITRLSPLTHVILGTGFTPGGDLIAASLDPDLIKLTEKLDVNNPKAEDKTLREQDFDFFRKDFEKVYWWRINISNGTQKHIDAPTEFPDRLPRLLSFATFHFLVDAHGEVQSNAYAPWATVLSHFVKQAPGARPDEGPR